MFLELLEIAALLNDGEETDLHGCLYRWDNLINPQMVTPQGNQMVTPQCNQIVLLQMVIPLDYHIAHQGIRTVIPRMATL